jgi:hypothetical protein
VSRIQHTLQHAGLLALGLLVASAGVVLGAAGGNFILGAANNAGTTQSALVTDSDAPYHALVVQQAGTGNAGYYVSQDGSGILGITKNGNKYGMSGTNDGAAGTGAAIIGLGKANNGLVATSTGTWGAEISNSGNANGGRVNLGGAYTCPFFCSSTGLQAYGSGFGTGVYGESDFAGVQGTGLFGVYGIDSTGDDTGYGVYSDGNAHVAGDLTVTGTCTGCTAALPASNGGTTALAPGDAVAVIGMTTDASGNPVISVAKAGKGDAVIGIVSDRLTVGSQSRADGSTIQTYTRSAGTIAAGSMLRVVTSGIAFASVDTSAGAISAGASLEAAAAGKVAKSASGHGLGFALGAPSDGRVAILVQVH